MFSHLTYANVIINEILASNNTVTRNPIGDYSDWIELYNTSEKPVNISNWYLTDTKSNLTKSKFPAGTTIPAHGYLIVFCDSSYTYPRVGGKYFANISLSKEGEYLGLIGADGTTIVSECDPAYPPQITDISYSPDGLYYIDPTPEAPNGTGYFSPVAEVEFSEPRGYKTESFDLTLHTETEGANIYYTLDGTIPDETSFLYKVPLKIEKTTYIRTIALKDGHLPSDVYTRTWIFPNEILYQSESTPEGWPVSEEVNGQIMLYGMDSENIKNPFYIEKACQGMTNIPSLSIVTDLKNLFDPQTGIYVNARNRDDDWERPISLELIDPSGNGEFQIDAGLRMRGSSSRSETTPKHAFRLFFRDKYGGKLKFPLFGDEGVSSYKKLDLRTATFRTDLHLAYVREPFTRYAQKDFDLPYTRGKYYNLYINGQYWGIYQSQERANAEFAADYLGGDESDWDCFKYLGFLSVIDGNQNAIQNFHHIAIVQGFTGIYKNNYNKLRGLDENGNRQPDIPIYLDVDNVIAYSLITYLVNDQDTPILDNSRVNNLIALYNRENPGGFKWLKHDSEVSMEGAAIDMTHWGEDMDTLPHFNPMLLHQRLMKVPEYRMKWIDAVQKEILNPDGILGLNSNLARWNKRQSEIEQAVYLDMLRWRYEGYTPERWLEECEKIKTDFLIRRPAFLIQFFRNRGWFPWIDAPSLQIVSENDDHTSNVEIKGDSFIYYTINGTDPRMNNNAINPSAHKIYISDQLVNLPANTIVKARCWNGSEWSAIAEIKTKSVQSGLRVTKLMYASMIPDTMPDTSRDDLSWIELQNTSESQINLSGYRFTHGIDYTFPDLPLPSGRKVVLVKNLDVFSSLYETNGLYILSGYSGNFAHKGETFTLESPAGDICTYTYSYQWYPETYRSEYPLEIIDPVSKQNSWMEKENWQPCMVAWGTPGVNDSTEKLLPHIMFQPCSRKVTMGENVSFDVILSDSADVQYQWYKDSVEIPAANESSYLLTNISFSNEGQYSVCVMNGAGSVWSQPADLIVAVPEKPHIISQLPQQKTVLKNTQIVLSVTATGTAPLTFQWYKDGLEIPNASQSTYVIPSAQASDEAVYTVGVFNSLGFEISSECALIILSEADFSVVFTRYDSPIAIDTDNDSLYFRDQSPHCAVDGNPESKYLNHGGLHSGFIISPIIGPTVVNLLKVITANDGAGRDPEYYELYGTNDEITSIANSTGDDEAWEFISAGDLFLPDERMVEGQLVYFPNETAYSSYRITFPKLKIERLGIMQVGEVQLYEENSSWYDYPYIQPLRNHQVATGASTFLRAIASGDAPIAYQWYKDGEAIDGATDSILKITAASPMDVGEYYVVASNAHGSKKSKSASIEIFNNSTYPVISYRYNNGILSLSFSGRLYESVDMVKWHFIGDSGFYEIETSENAKFYRTEK